VLEKQNLEAYEFTSISVKSPENT
jgi:hypothetical protein